MKHVVICVTLLRLLSYRSWAVAGSMLLAMVTRTIPAFATFGYCGGVEVAH